ncbi:oxidoreductase UcpA [Cupriavidus necator N-1]|jgi:NAD(P)-dependent dehydrogenase (short-subunit alcohol dehydrogenase family)|uniref:Oxidoreductase UcpA n=1 Tax=Cupriavidus necator (strain ATCC 43291 / DSM 13513 / CCUG 52238 / LMG 8453 / N-1) TaxID=1042878 RepID=F8GPM8_CUPNN|nr:MULTISPECIES: SDR family NAD(P)-dependent oxidoreductase [Cupriavidus]AEI79310.1 oxidoreductase UcpA [Cupriavidus necator N-1]KAI3606884.1 Dehydrogenase [Cupriavidus necator H850]MDX6011039.1 SDR family NAD(P)-dependent oxidoreductase [Cupriavidus necator]QUN26323.1 SDR family NAD(P)-dependent oxidoreductase [Cupriavidus sp. KK10]
MTAHRKLTGKIALVTGASRGIGRAIAQRFAAEGALVVATARRAGESEDEPGTLAETVGQIRRQGGSAIALAADLEDPAQRDDLVAQAASAAGGLDILVNNAGMAEYSRIESMPLEIFDRTVKHYLRIPFVLSRAAIPLMRTRGAGWILNLGSVTALSPARPYQDFDRAGGVTAYAAVKAAINRFTEGLAAELEADNIAVNSVAPSTAIRTPGSERYIPDGYPTEPVEYLVETALALCSVPARLRTGHIAHSLHFPLAHGLNVRTLDGQGMLPPPVIPSWAHPGLNHELSAR